MHEANRANQSLRTMNLTKTLILFSFTFLILSCRLGGNATGAFENLVLQENITGRTLTVTAPGFFEFSEEFDNDTVYEVVIDKANSTSVADCVISNNQGSFYWMDVSSLVVDCSGTICTMDYTPVCGKKDSGIVCITTPCPTRSYQTYSNLCALYADKTANTQFALQGECASIEGLTTYPGNPVQLYDDESEVTDSLSFELLSAEIDGDFLNLQLRYGGGCGEHDVSLYVSSSFMESFPVQVDVILVHNSHDRCKALISAQHSIDLAGLREHYRRSYQTQGGSIVVGELGTFSF